MHRDLCPCSTPVWCHPDDSTPDANAVVVSAKPGKALPECAG